VCVCVCVCVYFMAATYPIDGAAALGFFQLTVPLCILLVLFKKLALDFSFIFSKPTFVIITLLF